MTDGGGAEHGARASRGKRETIKLPLVTTKRGHSYRVFVVGRHRVAPDDIDWYAIEEELTKAVKLKPERRFGTLTVLGGHLEESEVAAIDIDDSEFCKGQWIDNGIARHIAHG